MRYEWQYSFTTKLLQFDKVVRYSIDLQKGNSDSSKKIQGFIEIRPNNKLEKTISTSGTVAVSIPFDIKEGTTMAHKIAYEFSQTMAFEFGDFQISWALLYCERIPETEQEKEEIGELTHQILQISLQTVLEKQTFNPSILNDFELQRYNPVLLKLFNEAEQKTDLIDKFLTRFKILEAEFIENNSRVPAKNQLKGSNTLKQVFYSIATSSSKNDAAFETLVDGLVDARGKCAHLKKYKYGYLPGDQRLKELQLLELQLRELSRALIRFT
ncbi:hypothetical protein [Hydrogenophaga sp. SL48]|uniref:hypothetical protein n=1 Tax=Hydrogenophaga sp. SL48 TaxID=2806347 RepID=UPI001F1DAECA|nr:hypothetical protein [Hydrogenophaga sp. SL48]UJW82549.1 hypothetical protein IM738_07655 [Hydrogenophaga sp. SL48]